MKDNNFVADVMFGGIYRVEYTIKGKTNYVYSRLVNVSLPDVARRYYRKADDERLNGSQFCTVLDRVRKKKAAKAVAVWEDNNIAVVAVSEVNCLDLKHRK